MTHIPRIICGCGLEMRPEENGVTLNVHRSDGEPYYLIQSDRLRCRGPGSCGASVYRLAHDAIAHHFQPDYAEQAERRDAVTARLA